ncbi:DUF1934 domain-containing protein [Sporosarcina sp. Te-1]|uniref:DUF1934 domain-containing protein n=1 Tax=Sporosarcina sp. Te-1 TaxID=2818390 RepID=UPI001A9DEF60|nr:DUF1934 domain-containing protein [Sporosarcina sp. Te-1]QTD40716.1 DUF1934 family protein [Sporosarcina sp. Te-1]
MEIASNERSVDVQLRSTIIHPGQPADNHALQAKGTVVEKAGNLYLRFEEKQNGQTIRTTVKLGREEALIMRSGAVQMRLPFTIGNPRPGTYGNGPATFNLLVKTKELEVDTDIAGATGNFHVHYELHADGALLGTYKLQITYTEG